MDCYVFSQVDYNVILFVAICTSEVEQNLSGSDLLVKFVHRALLKKTLDFSFSPGNSECDPPGKVYLCRPDRLIRMCKIYLED
jgi:hypothetical protein